MTTVLEQLDSQEKKITELEQQLKKKNEKPFNIRIPFRTVKDVKKAKENNKVAALWVGPNKRAQWRSATYRDGLWYLDDKKIKTTGEKKTFEYEEQAIFQIEQKKKEIPFVIFLDWRLVGVGGVAEEYEAHVINGKSTEEAARITGIHSHGRNTIVRHIEQSELDKEQTKKGGMGWLIWIVLAIGVIWVLMRMFGKSG